MLRPFWRCCFRLLYHELAFSYDLVSRLVSLGHWRGWQRAALDLLPPPDAGAVLELAHGTGDLQQDLLGRGYRALGIDLSPNMGRLAQQKLTRARLPARLVRGDARRLPFADAAFCAVVCAFPTAFITSRQALAEAARILMPTGCAVIVLSGRLHGAGLAKRLIRCLYRLSGQSDAPLDADAVRELFASPRWEASSQLVKVGNSSAQIVILKPIAPMLPLESNGE